MILCSPTEPAAVLNALAELGAEYCTHAVPEQLGADFVICTAAGTVGVQRKALPDDLLSSVEDGRLYNGLVRLKKLTVPILLLEGHFNWTPSGTLLSRHFSRFTRLQVRNLLRTVQLEGINVEFTDDPFDTALALTEMQDFYNKADHSLLLRRPKVLHNTWGQATDADYQLFLLQGLPTVGPTLARNIITHFGTIPWAWTCSVDELTKVKGMGKQSAEKVYQALAYRLTEDQLSTTAEHLKQREDQRKARQRKRAESSKPKEPVAPVVKKPAGKPSASPRARPKRPATPKPPSEPKPSKRTTAKEASAWRTK
jgi:ERCC4-type nuclease